MLTEPGYSNKVFYYNGVGENTTYDMRVRVFFRSEVNREYLSEAVRKTLAVFPNISVRPAAKFSRILYEDNHNPPPVLEDDGHRYSLGSDETNGYLFCFMCSHDSAAISFFHGLADFKGFWTFLRTVLYHYARLSGADVKPDAEVRLARLASSCPDPYSMFADENVHPDYSFKADKVFSLSGMEKLYPDGQAIMKNFEIVIQAADFLKWTKQHSTSFVPLIIATVSTALTTLYDTGSLPVVAKVPADLRHIFGIQTEANFSDSLILPMIQDLKDKSIPEKCDALLACLKAQLTRNNFAPVMARKIKSVIAHEESGKSLAQNEQEIINAASSSRPVTYSMTYPGRMDVPEGYQDIIKTFRMEPYAPSDGFFMFAGSYDGELVIRSAQRFDSDRFVREVARQFSQLGIDNTVLDKGFTSGSKVLTERFLQV